MNRPARMAIQVVLAFPDEQQRIDLDVPQGCTAVQALALACEAGLDLSRLHCGTETLPLGVFGERIAPDRRLAPGDRLEIYRPLQQDPKEARRRRAQR